MLSDALLIIDLQNGVCHDGEPIAHLVRLTKMVNQLIQQYREASRPIIFIRHNEPGLEINTYNWEILSEIDAQDTDIYINKTHANAFYQSDLDGMLKDLKIESLEICGAQTQFCVDATVKMAHGLGYKLRMAKNATSTHDGAFMTGEQTVSFFEEIWQDRFLELY
jgi:nicotinamidase-related amidase